MTAEQLWSKFAEKNGIKHNEYEAWQFGDAPDKLAELVLRGINGHGFRRGALQNR